MELGAFSISLAVKDIAASRAFYEKFGFKAFAGDASKHWLILKNGPHAIGLSLNDALELADQFVSVSREGIGPLDEPRR